MHALPYGQVGGRMPRSCRAAACRQAGFKSVGALALAPAFRDEVSREKAGRIPGGQQAAPVQAHFHKGPLEATAPTALSLRARVQPGDERRPYRWRRGALTPRDCIAAFRSCRAAACRQAGFKSVGALALAPAFRDEVSREKAGRIPGCQQAAPVQAPFLDRPLGATAPTARSVRATIRPGGERRPYPMRRGALTPQVRLARLRRSPRPWPRERYAAAAGLRGWR